MLMWAIFTVGYLLGVFITLKVFVSKEGAEDYRGDISTGSMGNTADRDPWTIYTQLTKINYSSENNNTVKKKIMVGNKPAIAT